MQVLLLKRPRVYKGGVDETKPSSYIRRLGRIQYSQDLCVTQFCAHTALRTFLKTSPGATRNEIDKVLMFHGHSEYDIRQAFSNAKDLFVVSGKYYFREPAPKKHHNQWYGVLNVKTSRAVVDFINYYEGLSEEKIISALSECGHRTNAIKSALNQPNKIVKINGCYYKQIQEVKKQGSKANVDLSQILKNKATEVKGEYYQYSMNQPEVEVVTGKTPVSFFYKNREVSLEGRWRNLLHRVCDVLSEIDVEKLRETVKLFRASYFGLSNAGMKDPYLHRSGIWINRNISAHGSIVYTRKFIEEFGANLDDFGIIFKNGSIDVVEDEEEKTLLKAHKQTPTSPTQQITKKKKRKIKNIQNNDSILGHHQNHVWQAASQPKYVIVNGVIERVKSAVADGEIMRSSSDSEDTWSGMGYLARDNGRFGSICGEDYAD